VQQVLSLFVYDLQLPRSCFFILEGKMKWERAQLINYTIPLSLPTDFLSFHEISKPMAWIWKAFLSTKSKA
jgi:hypothetical protein